MIGSLLQVAVAQVTEQAQTQVNKQESLCLMSQLLEVVRLWNRWHGLFTIRGAPYGVPEGPLGIEILCVLRLA